MAMFVCLVLLLVFPIIPLVHCQLGTINVAAMVDQGRSGQLCGQVMELVAEYSSDLLFPQFENVKLSIFNKTHWRDFVDYNFETSDKSPVLVGSGGYCHVISTMASALKLAHFTYDCQLSNNGKSNSRTDGVRLLVPLDVTFSAVAAFIERVGKWSELVVISAVGDSTENMKMALDLVANDRNQVKVVYHAFADQVDFQTLKEKGRIIFFSTSNVGAIAEFWCEAFDNGVQGSNFVFLLTISPDSIASQLPPGCNTGKIFSQMNNAFWFIQSTLMPESGRKISLGYTWDEFNLNLQKKLGNRAVSISIQGQNYLRCHDSMAQAMISTDQTLKNGQNFSSISRQNLYKTAFENDFQGFSGRYQYSERFEPDFVPIFVTQVSTPNSMPLFRIQLTISNNNNNENNFEIIRNDAAFRFVTRKQLPPDLSNIKIRMFAPPPGFYWFLVAVACLVILLIFVMIVITSINSQFRPFAEAPPVNMWPILINTAIGTILCILAASVYTVYTNRSSSEGLPAYICYCRIIFSVLGPCFITVQLVIQMTLYQRVAKRLRRLFKARRMKYRKDNLNNNYHSENGSTSKSSRKEVNFQFQAKWTKDMQTYAVESLNNKWLVLAPNAITVLLFSIPLIIWLVALEPQIRVVNYDYKFRQLDDIFHDCTRRYCRLRYRRCLLHQVRAKKHTTLAVAMATHIARNNLDHSSTACNHSHWLCYNAQQT